MSQHSNIADRKLSRDYIGVFIGPYTPSPVRVKRKMTSPYETELSLAKSAALSAGEIIRSYSNGNGGGRSANSATVAVKSVSLSCRY